MNKVASRGGGLTDADHFGCGGDIHRGRLGADVNRGRSRRHPKGPAAVVV